MCTTCNLKKNTETYWFGDKIHKIEGFQCQIDSIDFQSCADRKYKWLLNYQDHFAKFLYLRHYRQKEIAFELLKIFFQQGIPVILQSDNKREFTAEVIKELVLLWPECKIVHGRSRHLQSQSSVERSNQDVERKPRCNGVTLCNGRKIHRFIGSLEDLSIKVCTEQIPK